MSGASVRIGCDTCETGALIGAATGGAAAYCEACQRSVSPGPGSDAVCPHCGGPLTFGSPRFVELYGMIQHLDAVLAAWLGDPQPLGTILPERPRFHTDLTPVIPRAEDDEAARGLHEAVRGGHYAEALAGLEALVSGRHDEPRLWTSLAIAAERAGFLERAEQAWSRVIELEDAPRARLARGVLRARRAAFTEAEEDLEQAGDSHEARWDRAALHVLRGVALTPGLPDRSVLEAARDEAEAPEGAWHEPTVGRLLWTLLVERAAMRNRESASSCPDERVLRAAEEELEFDSFWDRALLLHGYAVLAMVNEAARLAHELAAGLAAGIGAQPAMRGKAGAPLLGVITDVTDRIAVDEPASAREAIAPLLSREDLRTYRFPCVACGKGTIGVEAFADVTGSSEPPEA